MKPIELRIRGLHSFREEQVIPFAELAEDGVFGIFGPTGSGKSTILDAMTLALYGTVGRADHNTRGILNHAEDRLAVVFEFAIGSPGDRRRFRVERTYRRRDEIAIQNVRSRLIDLTAGEGVVLADKDSEVTARIKEILGLELDDFTRAVVLPQGRFAEFLNLRGADRNRMLQRLFALERYGDGLMQRLRERLDGCQLSLKGVVSRQQGLGDASPEALTAAREALKAALQAEEETRKALAAAQAAWNEARAVRERQGELAEVEQALAAHEQAAPAVAEWRKRLERAEAAERVWPLAEARAKALREAEIVRAKQRETEDARVRAKEEEQTAQTAHEAARQQLDAEQETLLGRRQRLLELEQTERELAGLRRRLAELETKRQGLDAEAAEKASAQERLQEQLQDAETALAETEAELAANRVPMPLRQALQAAKDAQVRYQQAADEWQRLRAELRERDLAKAEARALAMRLSAEHEAAEQAWADLRTKWDEFATPPIVEEDLQQALTHIKVSGKPLWESWRNGLSRWQERLARCQAAEAAYAAAQEQVTAAERALEQAMAQLDAAKQQREAALWADKLALAARLREGLQEGEACPVCGSPHHPALVPSEGGLSAKHSSGAGTATGDSFTEGSADAFGTSPGPASGDGHATGLKAAEAVLRQAEENAAGAQTRVQAEGQALTKASYQWESARQALADEAALLAQVYQQIVAAWPEWAPPAEAALHSTPESALLSDGNQDGNQGPHLSAAACRAFAEFLKTKQERLTALQQRLEAWRQERRELEEQLARQNDKRQRAQAERVRAETALAAADKEHQRVEADCAEAQRRLHAAWIAWEETLTAAEAHMSHGAQMPDGAAAAASGTAGTETVGADAADAADIQARARAAQAWLDQALAAVDERDRQVEAANRRREDARRVQQQNQPVLAQLTAELQALADARTHIQWQMEQCAAEVSQRAFALAAETGGVPIAEALAALDERRRQLTGAVQETAARLEQARQQVAHLDREAALWRGRVDAAEQGLEAAETALRQALTDAGFISVSDVADARQTEAERAEAKSRIQAYEEEDRRLRAERQRIVQMLAGRFVDDDTWEKLSTARSQAEAAHSAAIRELGRSEEVVRDLERRHGEWQELEQERRKLQAELDNLQTLRQLFSGNKFVEFVAQEQLELVARLASDRLKQLTRNRYALEVAADGRFVMRDDFNGGVRRPVTSLSGGETFLTSLALALSLSTQIQLRGRHPLEFFFLDEGFGTLDPELLDVVMSTLERLRLERLTIGVISHVPEMRARMPRRLLVEPAEPSGRGSRVRLEFA
ncbi:MAG: SMC family ATPase [Alicyclobacillus herbarius]|uniref:AAA family ATPase n=1 Tax=Alicyclobacillus herbarius TaxID=122960 RepID=UPI002352A438|nr:SMC family ATPase [Alicyclobacillus herbarius]MCL6633071.1 SMC family ATPase [Alicyclobacillus herbarius]